MVTIISILHEYIIGIVDAANTHFCDDCYSQKKFLFCGNHFDLTGKTYSITVYLIEAVLLDTGEDIETSHKRTTNTKKCIC